MTSRPAVERFVSQHLGCHQIVAIGRSPADATRGATAIGRSAQLSTSYWWWLIRRISKDVDASTPQVKFAVDRVRHIKEVGRNAVPRQRRENRLGKGAGGVLERIAVLDAPAAGLWALGSIRPRGQIAGLVEAGAFLLIAISSTGKLRSLGLEFANWNRIGARSAAACVVAVSLRRLPLWRSQAFRSNPSEPKTGGTRQCCHCTRAGSGRSDLQGLSIYGFGAAKLTHPCFPKMTQAF